MQHGSPTSAFNSGRLLSHYEPRQHLRTRRRSSRPTGTSLLARINPRRGTNPASGPHGKTIGAIHERSQYQLLESHRRLRLNYERSALALVPQWLFLREGKPLGDLSRSIFIRAMGKAVQHPFEQLHPWLPRCRAE